MNIKLSPHRENRIDLLDILHVSVYNPGIASVVIEEVYPGKLYLALYQKYTVYVTLSVAKGLGVVGNIHAAPAPHRDSSSRRSSE